MKRELKDYLNSINQSKKNVMDEDGDAAVSYTHLTLPTILRV